MATKTQSEKNAPNSNPKRRTADIWASPKIKKILGEPVGTPIHLTREEALKIVKNSAGRSPQLPDGEEFVRKISG